MASRRARSRIELVVLFRSFHASNSNVNRKQSAYRYREKKFSTVAFRGDSSRLENPVVKVDRNAPELSSEGPQNRHPASLGLKFTNLVTDPQTMDPQFYSLTLTHCKNPQYINAYTTVSEEMNI